MFWTLGRRRPREEDPPTPSRSDSFLLRVSCARLPRLPAVCFVCRLASSESLDAWFTTDGRMWFRKGPGRLNATHKRLVS